MASRFDDYEGDGLVADGLWFQRVRTSLRGKRGQAILAELEEALLALPTKRLISGALAGSRGERLYDWQVSPDKPVVVPTPTGDVCLVGALALHRKVKAGKSVQEALVELVDEDDDGPYSTARTGENLGMSWSMAWHLGWVNDEEFRKATPEERYEKALAWVRHQRAMPGDGVMA